MKDISTLYAEVTSAIFRAERLDATSDSDAPAAHLQVSLIEEQIAELVPASDPEGAIARRGAIRAALQGDDPDRARMLVDRYDADPHSPETLKEDLRGLLIGSSHVDARLENFGQGNEGSIETRGVADAQIPTPAGPRDYAAGVKPALAALSKGTCYFPDCPTPIIVFFQGEPFVNVDVAHIRDAKPGNRYDAQMSDDDRRSFSNLLLLCKPHHTLVDKTHPERFSISELERWKADREHDSIEALNGLRGLTESHLAELIALATQSVVEQHEQRLEHLVSELTRKLDSSNSFEERVAALPAVARAPLLSAGPTEQLNTILDIVAEGEPRQALVQLTADLPGWLRDAPGATVIAVAELCRSYGVHLGAARLFELGAARSADRAYYLARAAAEYLYADDVPHSNHLIGRAQSLSTAVSVTAIAAALADDANTILGALSVEDALADPFLTIVRLYALRRAATVSEVIQYLIIARDRYPEAPGLMIELAWSLLQRSLEAATTSRTADRQTALELALAARRLRREWRVDAGDAVRVACQASLLLGAYNQVIALGMAAPDGEALSNEAAHPEVRLAVAQAAMAAGNHDLVRDAVNFVPEGFHRVLVQAEVLQQSGASPDAIQDAFDDAWALARNEEDKVLYWLSASTARDVDIQGTDELAVRADEIPLLVEAQQLIASGEFAAAADLLRGTRRTEHTTRLLVASLNGAGDVDHAVEELKQAATRFNEPSHLRRAVELLVVARRLDEAATLSKDALARVPRTSIDTRTFLHEVLVQHAAVAGAWGEMAVRAHAWIDDLGAAHQNRWLLALALHNGGDRRAAWQVVREAATLEPTTAEEARLWVALAAYQEPSPLVADRIVSLVGEFPDDRDLAQAAVGVFFGREDGTWGEVRPETVLAFQRLLTEHAVELGSGEEAAVFVVKGTPEEMLEKLRPSLEANADAISEVAIKVRQGWPYGLLSRAGRRPYTSALIHRAAGCLPIAVPDDERSRQEREHALAAVGSGIVIDISTLVIGGYLRSLWPQMRSSFARVEIPHPEYQDVLAAFEGFRMPSDGTLYFDTSTKSVRAAGPDLEVQATLKDQSQWVADEAGDLVITDWPRMVALTEDFDQTFLPWLSALDMAKARSLPLWCDDVGLRTLAANEGVVAFGTVALLEALRSAERIEASTVQRALQELREAYAVDLPLDPDWLRASAAADEWRPGPAAFCFSRAGTWINFDIAYPLWSELVELAASADPVRVGGWVHAAALGLTAAISPDRATSVIAIVAAKAVAATGFDGKALGASAARVREVALAEGLPNPVPGLMAALLRFLTEHVGPEKAAQLLTSSELEAADRAVVRDLIFGHGLGREEGLTSQRPGGPPTLSGHR